MKKLIIILTIAISAMLFAQNTISVVADTVANGTPMITVDFLLENADSVGGFQFDIMSDPYVLVGTGVSTVANEMTSLVVCSQMARTGFYVTT